MKSINFCVCQCMSQTERGGETDRETERFRVWSAVVVGPRARCFSLARHWPAGAECDTHACTPVIHASMVIDTGEMIREIINEK